jgi:hypothetical protein
MLPPEIEMYILELVGEELAYVVACVCRAWWSYIPNKKITEKTFVAAVKYGSIKLLEWLDERYCPSSLDCLYEAIRLGRVDMLEWFRTHDYITHHQPLNFIAPYIAEGGHEDVILWCQKHLPFTPLFDSQSLCFYNRLYILEKYVIRHGNAINGGMYMGAMNGNHLDLLDWLYEKNSKKIPNSLSLNIRSMEALLWCHEHKVKIYLNGKLDLATLIYGYEILKCEISAHALADAIQRQKHDVIEWLLSKQCDQCFAVEAAIGVGDIKTFQRVVTVLGMDYITEAAYRGQWTMVKWLVENGYSNAFTVTSEARKALLTYVIISNDLELVQWFLKTFDADSSYYSNDMIGTLAATLNKFNILKHY